MYFPTAGIEVSPWVPPAVAFIIALFTSMGGISGAFLLLPFQVSVLGFTSPAVSATNHLFNIVAIPGGVWRYSREGRMVWPLVWVIVLGTLPGVLIGALVRIHLLPDPGHFKAFVGVVLLYLGILLLRDVLGRQVVGQVRSRAGRGIHAPGMTSATQPADLSFNRVQVLTGSLARLHFQFAGQVFELSVPRLALLSLLVGVIGGIYGIGGGAIIAPFLITYFRIPVYLAAGAALMGTLVTSVAAVVFYQLLAPLHPHLAIAPDWALGLLFGVGGLAGMYCGARLQKFLPARLLKAMLVVCVVVPSVLYLGAFVAGF